MFIGTLMAPEVLTRVIFGVTNHKNAVRLTIKPALLTGYRRHRVLGCDYPAIIPHEGSTVRGSYVTGLTEPDLMRLDIFEGDQYTREKVTIEAFKDVDLKDDLADDAKGEQATAETYVWVAPLSQLEDKEWDFEHFRKERMRRWMGEEVDDTDTGAVDEGFADVDEAAEADMAGQDPTGGRGTNGSISRQLENQDNNHHLRMG